MDDKEAKQAQRLLYEQGVVDTLDEAAHMLVDMGEIDSTQHAELLTDEECERIYG